MLVSKMDGMVSLDELEIIQFLITRKHMYTYLCDPTHMHAMH